MRGAADDLELPIEVEANPDDDDEVTRIAPTVRPARHPQLGRYELRYTIATGGMATLHVAVTRGASGFGKVFALKLIHPHLATERSFIEMFLDEARIASLIQHPNVCSVIDFGDADGQYYLTMEYLVGVPLARLCWALRRLRHRSHQARVPLIAARLIADACEGLHAAHELCDSSGRPLHVVHRDVSPTNLFVTRDGSLKVVDFGVASAENRVHHTVAGMVKGKFAYMAPEQLQGTPIDRRADIWSLGVVLWEMVSGRALFRGKNDSETIMRVVRGQVPSLDTLCEGMPEGLDTVVRRALSLDRKSRFPSARAMGHALRTWLGKQPDPVDTVEISEWVESLFGDELREQHRLASRALSESTGAQALPRLLGLEPARTPSGPALSGIVERHRRRRPLRTVGLFAAVAALALAAFTITAEVIRIPAATLGESPVHAARAPIVVPRLVEPSPAPSIEPAAIVEPIVVPLPTPPPVPIARVWLPRPRTVAAQVPSVARDASEAPPPEPVETDLMVEGAPSSSLPASQAEGVAPSANPAEPATPPSEPEPEDPISENPY